MIIPCALRCNHSTKFNPRSNPLTQAGRRLVATLIPDAASRPRVTSVRPDAISQPHQRSVNLTCISQNPSPSLEHNFAELAAYPKSLGIDVVYQKNLKLAQNINNALQIVADAGFDLPTKIKIDAEYFAARSPATQPVATRMRAGAFSLGPADATNTVQRVIYLNPNYHWADGNYGGSTQHPMHPILHEFGHAAHSVADPMGFILHTAREIP